MNEREKTFKEYQMDAELRKLIVDTLKEEGLSEEQLDGMLANQVWKLYLNSLGESMSRLVGLASKALEEHPDVYPTVSPLVSKNVEEMRNLAESLERYPDIYPALSLLVIKKLEEMRKLLEYLEKLANESDKKKGSA